MLKTIKEFKLYLESNNIEFNEEELKENVKNILSNFFFNYDYYDNNPESKYYNDDLNIELNNNELSLINFLILNEYNNIEIIVLVL